MSSVETGQMSPVETGQMSAAETEQMSAVETRQMLKSQIRGSGFQAAMWLVSPWLLAHFHQNKIACDKLPSFSFLLVICDSGAMTGYGK